MSRFCTRSLPTTWAFWTPVRMMSGMPVAANSSTPLNVESAGALPNCFVRGLLWNVPSGTQTRVNCRMVPFLSETLTSQDTLSGAA